MPFETLSSPQKVLPSAAAGLTVTLKASWGSATWVELTPSTVAAWLLYGLTVGPTTAISVSYDTEFDVGVGGAGSEVVVTTFKGRFHGVGSGGAGLPSSFVAPIPLDNIGAGVRVAIRGRKDTTTDRDWSVKAAFSEKPVTHTMTVSAQPQLVFPSAANSVSVTPNASAWGNSGWIQLIASAAADLLLTALTWGMGTTNVDAEFDLGIGGAGAEVVIETVKVGVMDDEGNPMTVKLWPPLDAVPSGSRLAVRMRKTGTNTTAWRFAVSAVAKPL